MKLIKELQRRNVVRVAIGYIVSCWLLIQVADIGLETIGSPDWVMKTIMLVLALGFPIVAFFAWAYEVTPEGIKHQSEVDRNQSITHVTGRKLDKAIFVVLIVSLAYFIWESRFSERQLTSAPESSPVVNEAEAPESPQTEPSAAERRSIAVLPFTNRSNREEDQFFTDGIHDDLLTTLARIGSLKVISRTSVMEYRDTTKKIPEIAADLGVAHVMEGAIQRSGNQVRINVQLIDANTDEHLWAEIYDRELTAENLFAIQSEISTQIAGALQATLTPEDQQRMKRMPTDNLEAYDAYLRGKQLMATRVTADLAKARQEFQKAVELDPDFALAWVGVADSTYLYAGYAARPISETLETRQEAIDRALALDPTLGEAYASLGLLYDNRHLEEQMEEAYQKAIELSPNYATAYQWYSSSIGHNPLRSSERLNLVLKAAELDPRSMIIGATLAVEYFQQGLFSRGEQQALKVTELYPDFPNGHRALMNHYFFETGEFAKALEQARELERIDPAGFDALRHQLEVYLVIGDDEAAERVQDRINELNPDHFWAGWGDLLKSWSQGNAPAIRESATWLLQRSQDLGFMQRVAADALLAAGETQRARELKLQLHPGWLVLEEWEGLIETHPNEACIMSWVLINTEDAELGQALLEQALNYQENDLPAAIEHPDRYQAETCYLVAGDTEKALASLETQLAHGHIYDWPLQHRLPMYAEIIREPRYQAMLDERDRRIAEQRELIDGMTL